MESEDSKPLTPAQLAANRANAQKSTGPRTLVGKLHSSLNRMTHGHYSRQSRSYREALHTTMTELGEDPHEFAKMEDSLIASLLPADAAQKMLVHDLALLRWHRSRLERAQAALLARRVEQLELDRERKSLQVSQTISAQIPTSQLKMGLIWDQDSATKFQRLVEWLEHLQNMVKYKDFADADQLVAWIYGPNPTTRGAIIRGAFRRLAEAGADPPDPAQVRILERELLRELANVSAQCDLYLREHVDLTATMCEERLTPTENERWLIRQMSLIDQQIERKTRLLLAVQKEAREREQALKASDRPQEGPTNGGQRGADQKNFLPIS
jgi:hypothetical protein